MSRIMYSWEFSDVKNRNSLWYTIVFSIVIGLVIWGFFTQQYGMSFIVMLIAGLAYFLENNSEDIIQVEIGELGVNIAGSFYEYSKIQSCSYIYEKDQAVLLRFMLNTKGIRNVDVTINNTQAGELKEILPHYIQENVDTKLSMTEKVIRKIQL